MISLKSHLHCSSTIKHLHSLLSERFPLCPTSTARVDKTHTGIRTHRDVCPGLRQRFCLWGTSPALSKGNCGESDTLYSGCIHTAPSGNAEMLALFQHQLFSLHHQKTLLKSKCAALYESENKCKAAFFKQVYCISLTGSWNIYSLAKFIYQVLDSKDFPTGFLQRLVS